MSHLQHPTSEEMGLKDSTEYRIFFKTACGAKMVSPWHEV
eukprot:CAMPEP_0119109924 /NCGR_PEP_ID=MMETSP1180-20130426/24905_1 /TAXON_ID=3052 ORGANISM="Chlamydomonas cf sp, Strain CCMP681" /NCGR_SAMPLE_ID=MMETSP1180 /ASSEMBLY_ACC=CAM_ASM_000741 /LENGTH=39 /DNA_ID= /DNA_START= /DNA_END= /DNA_ORIENTATION=